MERLSQDASTFLAIEFNALECLSIYAGDAVESSPGDR